MQKKNLGKLRIKDAEASCMIRMMDTNKEKLVSHISERLIKEHYTDFEGKEDRSAIFETIMNTVLKLTHSDYHKKKKEMYKFWYPTASGKDVQIYVVHNDWDGFTLMLPDEY